MIRTIQGDEEIMLSVLSSVNEWTNNIRSNRTVNVSFSNPNPNLDRNSTQRQESIVPLPSVITAPHYANRDRRYKSSNEHYRTTIKPINRSTSSLCGDVGFISMNQKNLTTPSQRSTRKKGDSKSCQICSIRGHTYLKCEMLNTGNDGVIGITLQVNNRARRDTLAEDINSLTNTINCRKENDQRIVLQNLPKRGIAAL